MNAINSQPYQTNNGAGNIGEVTIRLEALMHFYPDQYIVIDMSRPVKDQPIILVDGDIAHHQADVLNRESGTQRYLAVKASDLK